MAKKYKLLLDCPKCGGGGVFPFEFVNGEGVPHPPENPQECDMCAGDGKIESQFYLNKKFEDDLGEIKTLCTQILEKLNET